MDISVRKKKQILEVESNILTTLNQANYGANFKAQNTFLAGAVDSSIHVMLASGQSETFASDKIDDIAYPTCEDTGLQVDVVVGSLLTDTDTYTADPAEIKYILVTLVVDDTTKALEMVSYEKILPANYGATPGGKTHAVNLKEYTIAAAGSTMTEIESWL